MTLKPNPALLLAATLAVSCGQPSRSPIECYGSLETSARQTTVKTVSGPVAGYVDDGVFIYKGIPYAKAERFAPAVDPDPWTDVRPSRAFGPTAPWTGGINDGKKRPVMVWLHGGGFREGSGQELICYDGTNLARDHGVVVVSLNHRLNVLGFLDLSAFGAKYAHSGNLGMMDIVKALEWVRDNIANFGGDPANVTIFGQSGGGGKVSTLMAMPSARGLFSKAIVESGSITNLLSPKYSRRIGAATAANLGLTPARIEEIAAVPYDRLLAAYDAAMKKVVEEAKEDGAYPANLLDAILFGQVPVVDGEIIPAQPGTAEALALSKDIPVIIGASAGCAPVYMYQFTWESPVLDGALGSTHCLEIPFVFDNVLLHRTFTGGGDDAVELGHRISRLWTSFAKSGVPSAAGIPTWEPWPAVMKLNIDSSLEK